MQADMRKCVLDLVEANFHCFSFWTLMEVAAMRARINGRCCCLRRRGRLLHRCPLLLG